MKKSDLANGVSYRFILKMFQAGEIQGISDAFARLFFAAVASAAVSAAVIGCGIRVFARNYFGVTDEDILNAVTFTLRAVQV